MYKKETQNGIILIRDDVTKLSKKSNVKVSAICPECNLAREIRFADITRVGHSMCQPCKQRHGAYGHLIGTRIGIVKILGFGEPTQKILGGRRTTLKIVCDCGNQTTIYAQGVKRAEKRGSTLSCGCVGLNAIKSRGQENVGSNNGMYNPDITDKQRENNEKRRKIQKAKNWSKQVKCRDNGCLVCADNKNIVAHHLNGFIDNPKMRYDVSNGVTLCQKHHAEFHYEFLNNANERCQAKDFYKYLRVFYGWDRRKIKHLISQKSLINS